MTSLDVPSEWNMQRVLATLGIRSKSYGQEPDEEQAAYVAYCPRAEFEKLSAIGWGPLTTQAIQDRRRTGHHPEAPQELVEFCLSKAEAELAAWKAKEEVAASVRQVR